MVNLMFIRFVCGEIDEDSHVSAGLFCAAFDLIKDEKVSDHDYAELADLMRWFRLNLQGPFEHRLRKPWRARRSICWFKPDAHETCEARVANDERSRTKRCLHASHQVQNSRLHHLRRRSSGIGTAVRRCATAALRR